MLKVGVKKSKKEKKLEEEIQRVRDQVGRVASQPGPVIAGPFTGEVGFELLYWIPFVRWAVKEFPELRGRLVVVSRGGVADWVEGLDARYVDILTLFSTQEFALHREQSDKQREVAEFELQVVERVKRHFGFDTAGLMHPLLFNEAYFRFLKINQNAYPKMVEHADGYADGLTSVYAPIEPPPLGPLEGHLPDSYVAIRFYSSLSFPDDEEGRRFTSNLIERLSRRTSVVMLGHRFDLDEHRDIQGELPENVISVDHLMQPDNNLALQTAVVGNARAFVGTYGGFAYLAPYLGVPSVSFSTDRSHTHPWHYDLADRVFEGPGWGGFVAMRSTDLPLVERVVGDGSFDDLPSARV
jgi:hypothetical protein